MQVSMFYNATNASTRMMLDASANGRLLDRAPAEAIEILNKLARNDFQFPTSRRGGMRRHATAHEIETSSSMAAQLGSLIKMVQNMQNQRSEHEVKAVNSSDYMPDEETGLYVGNYNRNNPMISNNYNSFWKRHSNFSWSNTNNAFNPINRAPRFQHQNQNLPQQITQQSMPQQ